MQLGNICEEILFFSLAYNEEGKEINQSYFFYNEMPAWAVKGKYLFFLERGQVTNLFSSTQDKILRLSLYKRG